MSIDLIIKDHALYIDRDDEKFINKFSSTTGNSSKEKACYLSSWYEGFIFTLLIGILSNNRRISGFKNRQIKMREWNKNTFEQYKYCLSVLLSKPEILRELNLDSRNRIDEEFANVPPEEINETILSKLKDIADQYSLGGIDYIRKLEQKDPDLFDNHPMSLYAIFQKAKNSCKF
ncbi:hypothetical protein KRX57_02195 [Weeksellaceae bacterium TAE3-ERU29]|nr:hypothetical protein [Weeksellaceae bacterium TAE3-ERU29]